ncbi:MAG TPA: MlaD family protein [Chitinophagales bacterium]|nr:MlaD family protein [Chitinophagales bacterium]
MKISDETKVGVLAAFGLAILIIGYNFLRGKNIFEPKREYYYAVFSKVEGLNPSDPVTLNGLPIGKVASLGLLDDSSGKSIARIHLVKKVKIPTNSAFQLYSSDLLGEKAVQLILGDSKELAREGDTLSGLVSASLQESVNEQIAPVKQKAENLLLSIDTVIESIKVIVRGGQIESSMASIEKATNEFEKVAKNIDTLVSTQRETLSRTFTHIERITATLDSNSANITRIFENFGQISDSLSDANLKQTINNMNKSLDELQTLLDKINRGDGTLGLLVTDRKLYDNLNNATKNLETLLADLEANPKKYVHFSLFGRGEKEKKKQPASGQ